MTSSLDEFYRAEQQRQRELDAAERDRLRKEVEKLKARIKELEAKP